MVSRLVGQIVKDPLGVVRRFFWKTVIGPWRYVKRGRYDAESYWHDRYAKYGTSLRGAGEEGLSEEENTRRHRKDADAVLELCRQEGVDWPRARVLDVGCGNGFYAGILRELGVKRYTGVDITDVLFPRLRETYPGYEFLKGDITADAVPGEYDVVFMFFVIIHIMEQEQLDQAMRHVERCLAGRGIFLLGPLKDASERRFFYLRTWSVDDVKRRFPGYHFGAPIPFRDGYALAIRKP
jgi:SAM-dependent methyltransferase